MEKFLIDANIILGLLNKEDQHHKKCLKFFQEIDARYKKGEEIQGFIPLHLAIEVNINIRKRKRDNTFNGISPLEILGPKFYPIDLVLLQKIQKNNLYDKFDKLKSLDAIYAIIAYLENMQLVTLDRHFEKVKDIIKIKFI